MSKRPQDPTKFPQNSHNPPKRQKPEIPEFSDEGLLCDLMAESCQVVDRENLDSDWGEEPEPSLQAAMNVLSAHRMATDGATLAAFVKDAKRWLCKAIKEAQTDEDVMYGWSSDHARDLAMRNAMQCHPECPEVPYSCIYDWVSWTDEQLDVVAQTFDHDAWCRFLARARGQNANDMDLSN